MDPNRTPFGHDRSRRPHTGEIRATSTEARSSRANVTTYKERNQSFDRPPTIRRDRIERDFLVQSGGPASSVSDGVDFANLGEPSRFSMPDYNHSRPPRQEPHGIDPTPTGKQYPSSSHHQSHQPLSSLSSSSSSSSSLSTSNPSSTASSHMSIPGHALDNPWIYTDHPSSRAGQPVAAPRQKQRQGASANGDLSTVAELSNSEHISTTHNPGHDRHHHPPAESSQREDANEPGGFVLADGSSPYMATGSSSGGWSTSATSATMSSTMSGSSTERPYRDRDLDSVPSIHYPPVDSMSSESEGNFLGGGSFNDTDYSLSQTLDAAQQSHRNPERQRPASEHPGKSSHSQDHTSRTQKPQRDDNTNPYLAGLHQPSQQQYPQTPVHLPYDRSSPEHNQQQTPTNRTSTPLAPGTANPNFVNKSNHNDSSTDRQHSARVAQGYGLHSPGHSEQQFSVQRQHRPLHGGGGTVQDVAQQGYAKDGGRPVSGEAARMSDPESTVYLDHAPQVRKMSPLNDAGGYDFNFVEPLKEAHRCPICNLALRVPVQTTCGHRFCKTCIDPLIAAVESAKCPVDDAPVEKTFPDKCCEREVLDLKVRCNNHLNGCDWTGKIKELEGHRTSCKYSLVKCPNMGCTAAPMLQRDLARHCEKDCHFRKAPCRHCQQNVPLASMDTHVHRECLEYKVDCPMNCGAMVRRRDLSKHNTTECPLASQDCAFAPYGCRERKIRADLDRHLSEATPVHLKMVSDHGRKVEAQLERASRDVQDLQSRMVTLQQQLTQSQEEVKRVREAQQTKQPIDVAALLENDRLKRMIDAIVEDRVSLRMAEVRRSVETSEQRSQQAHDSCKAIKEQTQECVKTLGQMSLTAARSDAALAEVDLRLLAVETNSYNGMIVFKINNFRRRLDEARTGRRVSLYSPTFYTNRHGYKVCLRVYLNGDGSGKGTHVSVFFTIMKGEFDSLLDWPFRAKVTFSILDQGYPRHNRVESFIPDQQSSSFQRPVNDMNIASGCPKMISHDELFSKAGNYLRDDCLYIKAAVDPSACRSDM